MAEHWISPWYCVGCGAHREVADFGQPCEQCGGFALACDEAHSFTFAELREFARLLDAIEEEPIDPFS